MRLRVFDDRHVDLYVYIECGPYCGRVCNIIFARVSAILNFNRFFRKFSQNAKNTLKKHQKSRTITQILYDGLFAGWL